MSRDRESDFTDNFTASRRWVISCLIRNARFLLDKLPVPVDIKWHNGVSWIETKVSWRLLTQPLDYNLLFRWFVGMEMDGRVWDHAVFNKSRERLLNQEIAEATFQRVRKITTCRTNISPRTAP